MGKKRGRPWCTVYPTEHTEGTYRDLPIRVCTSHGRERVARLG